MIRVFNGHPYIKSALDMACSDLAARTPPCRLSHFSAAGRARLSNSKRSSRVCVTAVAGSVPKGTVIFCDANAGWTPFQARQLVEATRDIDYVFEQPCTAVDECLSVRQTLNKPMVLDECGVEIDQVIARSPPNVAQTAPDVVSRRAVSGVGIWERLEDLLRHLLITDRNGRNARLAAGYRRFRLLRALNRVWR